MTPSLAPASWRASREALPLIEYQIANVVVRLFEFYQILVLVWCIISWIPRRPDGILNDIAAALDKIVSPYLGLFRRFIPPFGGIDFSPVVALLVLQVIEQVVVDILVRV